MENPTLKLSKLTDADLAICAAQLAAAACASLPRLEDEQAALERSQKLFEAQCQWLLVHREKKTVYMAAKSNLD